jgi:hypothetical protein
MKSQTATAATQTPSIAFRCRRQEHIRGTGRYTLTIHRGRWAFCPHESRSSHDWVSTGGVQLPELLRERRAC